MRKEGGQSDGVRVHGGAPRRMVSSGGVALLLVLADPVRAQASDFAILGPVFAVPVNALALLLCLTIAMGGSSPKLSRREARWLVAVGVLVGIPSLLMDKVALHYIVQNQDHMKEASVSLASSVLFFAAFLYACRAVRRRLKSDGGGA